MYADDICLLELTASPIQSLLDVCYEYGIDYDIIFKLYIPTVFIGQEALKYVSESKYLGFSLSDSKCDDCDMLRQMRSLYAKSKRLLRVDSCCIQTMLIENKFGLSNWISASTMYANHNICSFETTCMLRKTII